VPNRERQDDVRAGIDRYRFAVEKKFGQHFAEARQNGNELLFGSGHQQHRYKIDRKSPHTEVSVAAVVQQKQMSDEVRRLLRVRQFQRQIVKTRFEDGAVLGGVAQHLIDQLVGVGRRFAARFQIPRAPAQTAAEQLHAASSVHRSSQVIIIIIVI